MQNSLLSPHMKMLYLVFLNHLKLTFSFMMEFFLFTFFLKLQSFPVFHQTVFNFVLSITVCRSAALLSTLPRKSFFGKAMVSLWTGGPWASSCMSSWWVWCLSLETHPRSCLDRLSQVCQPESKGSKTLQFSLTNIYAFFSKIFLKVFLCSLKMT